MKTKKSIWRIFLLLCIAFAFTLSCGGQPEIQVGPNQVMVDHEKLIDMVATLEEGSPTSYTRRGNEPFVVGYYVKDGSTIGNYSLLADTDSPVSNLNLDLVADGEAFNPVIATGEGTDLTLTGAISAYDNGDGKKASDFSGLGAMIIAADSAKVNVNSMKIDTKGFVRAAFISDNHAQILVRDSTVTTMGANPLTDAYAEYVNSADQNIMLSPPWVLGIQGGIRTGNMLGDNSTLTVINSSIASGGWAVLSTDACTSPMMNVVDSTLEILPASKGGMSSGNFSYSSNYGSGYGTYLIGNSVQNFYGTTFKGMTYASIFTGGDGYYRSSAGNIELTDAHGEAIETVTGKGNPTVVNTVWGFMTHGGGSVNVLDGTIVNSEEAVFLHKRGGVSFIADNAVLNSASGILLQMIDNDDTTVGGAMTGFNTEFNEDAGWPSESGNVTEPGSVAAGGGPGGDMGGRGMPGGDMGGRGMPEGGMPGGDMGGRGMPEGGMPGGDMGGRGMPEGGMPGGDMAGGPGGPGGGGGMMGGGAAKLVLTNGDYKGDVLNGSGYYNQSGNALEVSIGQGATLDGAISLTETRHVDENGNQNTYFTINEYYYLGHVENRNYRNETATISVSLKDGGKWTVTGEGLISELVVDNGTIEGADGAKVVMKIDGEEKPIKQGETYSGDIVISLVE
jgi:hypothetical protein